MVVTTDPPTVVIVFALIGGLRKSGHLGSHAISNIALLGVCGAWDVLVDLIFESLQLRAQYGILLVCSSPSNGLIEASRGFLTAW